MAASVGPPLRAVATPGRELRQSLPPALVEALDKIGDQIGTASALFRAGIAEFYETNDSPKRTAGLGGIELRSGFSWTGLPL
jgi:hypothetical protein